MLSKKHKATMLESQTSKLQDSDGWTISDKKYSLMKYQFGSPKVLGISTTKRNKHLLRCRINRSLNFDFNFSRKDNLRRISPNSKMDNSCFSIHKPSRDLSRSAKIMRALSSDILFCHRNESVKKSLKFESSPSKTNSPDESTSLDSAVNTPLHTPLHTPDKSSELDRNSTDASITSSVPTTSLESIDENQNRTPQQSRKAKTPSSNTKRSTDKSGSPGSASLLRSNLKDMIDNITSNMSTPDFQCFKQDDKRRSSSCDVAASTPRNLFKELNNDEDSPHTPENIMQFIPEGMSSIKKSHKKERSYCVGRRVLELDDDMKINLHDKRPAKLLEPTNTLTSSNSHVATVKESPKKSRNVKKALVYNLDDEFSDNESIFDDTKKHKAAPKNIDSSDCEMYQEKSQDIHDILPSTSSISNYDQKENDSHLEEASSSKVDSAELKNVTIPCESNFYFSNLLASYKDPKQYKLTHDITTDILLYHVHLKEEKQKILELPSSENYPKKCPEMNAANPKSVDIDFILNKVLRSSKAHKRPSLEDERPSTPENINSSRLLLPQYTSVKKSHKKDKRKNKSIASIIKNQYDEYKKSISLFMPEENADKYKNESLFLLSSSPDESNQKKKRFMSTSLLNDKLAYSLESSPSRCQNTVDESEIYTPTRKKMSSILDVFKICRNKLGKDNKPIEAADRTDENGRLTPVNMSTTELLHNIDSIKKSHKKDKHDGSICRKRILAKKLSEQTEETEDINAADCTETSEGRTTPSLKLNSNNNSYDEMGACSNTHNEDNGKSNEESIHDPQPSTSREDSVVESKKDMKSLSTTPPNNWSTLKFMKLLHATSIKKSHKKERILNAQSKYILMNHEYDLSDDGSIFDEEDKSTYVESSSPCQYDKN